MVPFSRPRGPHHRRQARLGAGPVRSRGMRVGVDTGGTFTDVVTSSGHIAKVPVDPARPGVGGGRRPSRARGPSSAFGARHDRGHQRRARGPGDRRDPGDQRGDRGRRSRSPGRTGRRCTTTRCVGRRRWSTGTTASGSAGRLGRRWFRARGRRRPADGARSRRHRGGRRRACCTATSTRHTRRRSNERSRTRASTSPVRAPWPPSSESTSARSPRSLNAALRPVCRSYLARVGGLAADATVMASSGGLLDLDVAADVPAALLLSGPAGGVGAAAAAAMASGFADVVTFDMGGTVDRRVPGAGRSARAGRGPRTWPGTRCGSPASTSTPSAPVAARSRWLDAGGALRVGPGPPAPDPVRPATDSGAPGPR